MAPARFCPHEHVGRSHLLCCSLFIAALGEDHLAHVRDVKSAIEIFKSITDLFERVTLLNKLVAHRKFYTATMVEVEKIITFLNRVKTLASTLKTMALEINQTHLQVRCK